MTWVAVAVLNGVIALCYFAICFVIARGLHVTNQMWTNRLATATAGIFLTCAVHHGAQTLTLLGPEFGFQVEHGLKMRSTGWTMAAWDFVGATVAVYYLSLRRSYAKLLDAPVLFSATPLDSAERRLALLSDAAADRLLVLLGPDGEIREWPEAATQLTDIPAEEAEGRPGPEAVSALGLLVLDAAGRSEAELRVGDGASSRWLEATCTPVHDDDELIGWGLVLRDVTARRRDEAAVRAAHGMLASVLDAATATAVIATDLEGTITVFNAGAEAMLGHDAAALVGRASLAVLHDPGELAAESAAAGLPAGLAVVVDAARQGGAQTRDWTYLRADGTPITASVTVTATRGGSDDDEPDGFLAVAADVTARRRDERLLQMHVDVAHALASDADPDEALRRAFASVGGSVTWQVAQLWLAGEDGRLAHRVAWTSRPGSRFVAGSAAHTFAPGEGLPGQAWASGQPAWTADMGEDARATRAALAREDGLRGLIAVPVGSDDGVLGVLEFVSESPHEPEPDEIAALEATGRLVGLYLARRRALEEVTDQAGELRRKTLELERSNLDLEHFASVASHDLQEPLRKIQTFGDQLQRKCADDLDERGQMYVERMQAASTRMRTLIEDLLSYSRVTSGARPFADVDLGELAAEVLDDLERAVEDAGAEVHVGTLATIAADRTQMRQLLQNLLANALKFRREGVPHRVEVCLEREGEELLLSVTDNGIGFDEQYADRIFGIFERLHGRQEYAGTGIGLAVCRKIAERHGGDIGATGVPGEGATFTVRLPASVLSRTPEPA